MPQAAEAGGKESSAPDGAAARERGQLSQTGRPGQAAQGGDQEVGGAGIER